MFSNKELLSLAYQRVPRFCMRRSSEKEHFFKILEGERKKKKKKKITETPWLLAF